MTKPAPRFPLPLDRVPTKGRAPEVVHPQRPLREAARSNVAAPSGVGLDSAAVRARMVQRLRAAGIDDERVLAAFDAVPRHAFVDSALVNQAYEDTSLPIGFEQTISKPSVVARMLALLADRPAASIARPLGKVLEVGTGCGYQAALLSELASSVVSIERVRPLHERARANLDALGRHRSVASIRLVFGDGLRGHPPNAPYDTIIAAAGGDDLPATWVDQLAEGGRLVAPWHDAAIGGQRLVVIDRRGGLITRRALDAVHFVPLKSGTQ